MVLRNQATNGSKWPFPSPPPNSDNKSIHLAGAGIQPRKYSRSTRSEGQVFKRFMHPSNFSSAKSTALVAIVSLPWILISGCGSEARSQNAAPPPPTVLVTTAHSGDVPIFSEYPAQTYARNTVDVRARVDGYIEKWLFRPGQEVQAGDTLYVLDMRPYEAALDQAKGNLAQSEADLDFAQKQVALLQAEANLAVAQANLVKAQQDVDRLTPLVKADAASKQDLDAAVAALGAGQATVNANQANVDQARLSTRTQIASTQGKVEALRGAVRTAQLNLEYATIRAPISGLIGDTQVPVGGLVNAASPQPLTTIVPLDPIWVRFKVTETEYLDFKKRGNLTRSVLTLVLADGSEFPHKGRVENTVNQVDPKTGTLELQARFSNPQHVLLPGQFGKVRFETDVRKRRGPGSAARDPTVAEHADRFHRGFR